MASSQHRSTRASPSLPALLPQPRRSRRHAGYLALSSSTSIDVATMGSVASSGSLATTTQRLQAGIRAICGLNCAITTRRGGGKSPPFIELTLDPSLEISSGSRTPAQVQGDRYRLRAGRRGIEIIGAGESGLRYGVETLLQLITTRGRIPRCLIEDSPDLSLRGIMLDVSRGKVPTQSNIEALIDTCASLKINVLMLYTEHTFRFTRHPAIGKNDSPLDAKTMRNLSVYAAQRCVDLIPCLQSLGHMEHILKLPRYRALAESSSGWTIAPTDPGTYSLLSDLYAEYLPLFDSKYFNANCDEPWDLGRGRSESRSQNLGPGGLYLEHVERIQKLARKHGKRTMIWGDVVHAHADRIPEVDRNLILLDWWYEAQFAYDRVSLFAKNRIEFMVCPGTSTWNSLFPRVENSLKNISRWAKAGRRHGALGLLNTDWGDHGHYNLEGNSLFAYAWGAQESWTGGRSKNFDRAFSALIFGDKGGRYGQLFRKLGAIHDPGFQVFNGSPLQFVFFDSVEKGYFISKCRPGRLKILLRQLTELRPRVVGAGERANRNALALDEMLYALDASLLAVRKAQAGLDYLDWRRRPNSLNARARRVLARRLLALSKEQNRLGTTLRKLWLARAQPSNLDVTLKRLRRSSRHLRSAAQKLENNRPRPVPPPSEISVRGVREAMIESLG